MASAPFTEVVAEGVVVVVNAMRAVVVVVVAAVGFTAVRNGSSRGCGGRCHAPNTFGTVNMEHTIDLSLSWSE